MSTVWQIVAALVFFALILVSVGLHELGHFIPSKLFRVKVTQFFIGFGKNLWKTKRGETEYGVKLVPLGGYVQLVGMYPPQRPGKDTRLKRLADSARASEWEKISQQDVESGRLFYQRPIWQRLVVMAAGVSMNLLVAFLLFAGVNLGYGQSQPQLTVQTVQACLDATAPTCQATPAGAAGLLPGDRMISLNGVAYDSWDGLSGAIRDNLDNPVSLVVERPGQGRVELPTVPGQVRQAVDRNDSNRTVTVGFLGVSPVYERVPVGPVATLAEMGQLIKAAVQALIDLPVSVFQTVVDLATGAPRDDSSPISVLGASILAGQVATAPGAEVGAKVAVYLLLLAQINLFVAIFNLVPLLPFDGGHIAAALFEGLRRGWAKLRRRPDPGPADTAKLLPVAWLVAVFLVIVFLVLIVADIFSPVSLF
ncbi:MAG: site-2 protease family protein [Propionibacteriaceae bacterium]|jgi:membrane-associated protease RseP (regulator of RpoE activity)|nr:site-2 protease family protein [Propionibacteriaceae bacterium]